VFLGDGGLHFIERQGLLPDNMSSACLSPVETNRLAQRRSAGVYGRASGHG